MVDDVIKDPTPTVVPLSLPITPQFRPPNSSREQRDMSLMTTMEIFDNVRSSAKCFESKNHDPELWNHLEGRLKYLLNMVGMR